MLAQSHARKPAPPLAARGMWLRLRLGADAFGSALGDSIVGAIARGDGNKKVPDGSNINYDEVDMDGEAHVAAAQALDKREQADKAELERQKWANWDRVSKKVFEQEDAQMAADHLAATKRQNAKADAYGKQQAAEALARRQVSAGSEWDGGAGGGRGSINPPLASASTARYGKQVGPTIESAKALGIYSGDAVTVPPVRQGPVTYASQWDGKSNDPYERARANIGMAIVGPQISTVGGAAAIYSPLGFAIGAGGDAAGQFYQGRNNPNFEYRLGQSIFSGVTGAIALPLAGGLPAISSLGSGVVSIGGNAVVGGATAAANTAFNNAVYKDATSLYDAGMLGAGFSAIGTVLGAGANRFLSTTLPNVPYIPVTGPAGPFSAQGTLNRNPSRAGNTLSNTIGAIPAFITLDSGIK